MRATLRLGALFLIAFLGAPALAADDGVRLIVRTNKDVIAPFEPVIVNYAIVNASNASQSVPGLTDSNTGWVKFEVTDRSGRFRLYHTGVQGCAPMSFVTLKPGERFSEQVVLLTNLLGGAPSAPRYVPVFPFAEPGFYKLKVTYPLDRASDGTSRRELVTIVPLTVKPSHAVADDLERFAGPDDLAAAIGADADADIVEAVGRWERILAASPGSIFAPFVRFNLGVTYRNGVGEEVPDHPRAAAHFWAVTRSGPSDLVDDALVGFAQSQIKLGGTREASAALNRVVSEFPLSNSARYAARLLDGLAEGSKTRTEILSR